MSAGDLGGRRPDFLVAGEMRCGTTTLWSTLARHPRIFFPERKELHFFSSHNESLRDGRLDDDALRDYFALFSPAGRDQRCGEATPGYLFDEGACRRIHEVLPDVRILVILRDPVARAWSHYWHQVRRGREKLSFEDALAAEPERMASADARGRARFSYQSRGRYVESLRRYEARFSREQICTVFLEELRREPEPVVERVFSHLGLGPPPGAAPAVAHANKAAFPRWPRLDGMTRAVRSWADERPALREPVRALGRWTRPWRVYSGRPRMPDATREQLRLAFAETDAELSRWLGTAPPWLRPEGVG